MVTIPTIDQISGTTVMNKMRSLIHAFINFATGVNDEMTEFESSVMQDYYTKIDINTNFYTKNETNIKFTNYYTKNESDEKFVESFGLSSGLVYTYMSNIKYLTLNIDFPITYDNNKITVAYDNTTIKKNNNGQLYCDVKSTKINNVSPDNQGNINIQSDNIRVESYPNTNSIKLIGRDFVRVNSVDDLLDGDIIIFTNLYTMSADDYQIGLAICSYDVPSDATMLIGYGVLRGTTQSVTFRHNIELDIDGIVGYVINRTTYLE